MQDFARLDVEKKGRVIVGGRCLGTVALTCAPIATATMHMPQSLATSCNNPNPNGW